MSTQQFASNWIKWPISIFVLVWVPCYWINYGPSVFLYFCDIELLLTLIGLWCKNQTMISMAAVGILLPQLVWIFDFVGLLFGIKIIGATSYMLNDSNSLLSRFLSLFHVWLPFLLLYLIKQFGYQKPALIYWIILAWVTVVICYLYFPPPGTFVEDINTPVNINYVYGFSIKEKQLWMSDTNYFLLLLIVMPLFIFWPAHKLLIKITQ